MEGSGAPVTPEQVQQFGQGLMQLPIDATLTVEKGVVPAADGSGSEAWLLCFINASTHGMEKAATFLFGDSKRAAQALPLLGSIALFPYSLPASLLACNVPISVSCNTTSRRLLSQARHGLDAESAPQFLLGIGGSEACAAALDSVGISQRSLFDSPRLLVELHLPDLEKVVVMLLPHDRRVLMGGSSRGPPPPGPALVHIPADKIVPPKGASKYLHSEGNCHCCQAGAGVKLKSCDRCGVARYCSKECQAADWPEHRPVCRPLAEYRNKMRAAMEAAKQALLPAASSSGTRGHKPTAAKPAPRS